MLRRREPVSLLSIGLGGVHADGPGSGLLVRLHGPVDAAGGMFGAPAFEVVEGLGVVVEVFLGPGGAQVPLSGHLTRYQRLRRAAEASGIAGNLSLP